MSARLGLMKLCSDGQLNADAMATEKLTDGIRNFDADIKRLIDLFVERMASQLSKIIAPLRHLNAASQTIGT